jgi:aspartyl/asparaginyl beta-hydroxylase (cupin superfamily)
MRAGRHLMPIVNRAVLRASLVGNAPLYDGGTFPWVAALEKAWPDIRDEATAVLADLNGVPPLADISPDHRDIAPAGKWRSFFLYGYGYREEINCRRCPRTTAALANIPGLNSAFFSVLVPRTHIPAHTGVSKAILTCHLGIRVPARAEACRMRVGDRTVSWRAGEALIFDDTVEHEVLNETDEVRVVLLIQFRRPVRRLGRWTSAAFLWAVRRTRFVQDARRGVKQWAEQQASAPNR